MSRLLSLFLLCVAAMNVQAWDFRCEGRKVKHFSRFDLVRYCGEPEYVDHILRAESSVDALGCEVSERWYYISEFGGRSYAIDFEDGFVARITEGRKAPLR